MFKRPFSYLAVLILATSVCPIFLPLAILLGYPGLVVIGLWFAVRWLAGRLEKPAEVAATWMAYLGLILTLHGIVLCIDISLGGAPLTAEEKRFGTNLAYLGGAIAVVSGIVGYAIDLRRRIVRKPIAKPDILDDLAT